MKVIIDGCDLTGKTTLINKLKEYYSDNISYLHFSYKDRRDYLFYNTLLDKENFISDRHFLDELIYSTIFNRTPELTLIEFEKLITKCKQEDIKIIILTVDDNTLLNRSLERNEEPEIINNLLFINKQFKELANKYNLALYDTTINSIDEIINYIGGINNEKYTSNKVKRITC